MKKSDNNNGSEKNKKKAIFEIALVVGLILLIPLFFAMRTEADAPYAPSTDAEPAIEEPSADEPSIDNTEAEPVVVAKQPPACTFPLAEIEAVETEPEEYVFSEPEVVLTAPKGNPLNVAQWLPDNQQVLITEDLRNEYIEKNNTTPQQTISLYNIKTGETHLYAIRASTDEPPEWHTSLNGVVYSTADYTNIDKKNNTYEFSRQLRVSYGNPDAVELLADDLSQLAVASQPSGNEIVYFSSKQISRLNRSLEISSSTSFNSAQWDYATSRRNDKDISYYMEWQPDTPLVFLFSQGGPTLQGGYTYLLNTTTGDICELALGGPVSKAHWSSDGRYLAVARWNSYSTGFLDKNNLVVLDSVTGDLYTSSIISSDLEHTVQDFTWAPDNFHLLTLVDIPSTYDPYDHETIHHELYIVDFKNKQSTQLFSEFQSFYGSGTLPNNFAWSPDGSKFLLRCSEIKSTGAISRFCLIRVQKAVQ